MVKQEEFDVAVSDILRGVTDDDHGDWFDEVVIDNVQLVAKFYGDKAVTARNPERTHEYDMLERGFSQLATMLDGEKKRRDNRGSRATKKATQKQESPYFQPAMAFDE